MPQTVIRVFRTAKQHAAFVEWLEELATRQPVAYAKCLERILQLEQFGFELRRPICDMLRDGIRELRVKVGRVNYRILYFFCGENIACLSHGIKKERIVPDKEIDLALERKNLVVRDLEKYTAEWEL
jgi:putative component of toxin-antitoxin plasmid stabilization module